MASSPAATDTIQPVTLLKAFRALKKGDFSARLPDELTGTAGQIAENFNDVAELFPEEDVR